MKMAEFNLPDGCTCSDIDRAMRYDDVDMRCSTCTEWEPLDVSCYLYGICRFKVDNLVSIMSDDIVKEIAENCITKYKDTCDRWELFA